MILLKLETQIVSSFSRGLKIFGLILLCLSLVSCTIDPVPEEKKIVHANRFYLKADPNVRCGVPIRMEEILIVDLDQLDRDAESLVQDIGPFIQVTEKPIAVSGSGPREKTEQRVRKVAAERGCDVVLLGPVETRTEIWGGNGISTGSGGGKSEVPYQLFRMGYRTD